MKPIICFISIVSMMFALGCQQKAESLWTYETRTDPITDVETKIASIETDGIAFGVYQQPEFSYIHTQLTKNDEVIVRFDKHEPITLYLSHGQFWDETYILDGLKTSSSLALKDPENGTTVVYDIQGFNSAFFDESQFVNATAAYLQERKEAREGLIRQHQLLREQLREQARQEKERHRRELEYEALREKNENDRLQRLKAMEKEGKD